MTSKIGSFFIDLEHKELTQEEREILAHPLVAGVILFTRNYESRQQLKQLCHAIRACSSRPLLILTDQEGGRVQRFIKEFTRIPAMSLLGQLYEGDPTKASQLAQDCGWLMATEILTVGIDLSLAPVLDLNKKNNPAIGDRAFHANPEWVVQLAQAFISGMIEAGMSATGKHFPGHGSVSVDSHLATPINHQSYAELQKNDLQPFSRLVDLGLKSVMTSHIIFPLIDDQPVTFSHRWLTEILRHQLGFSGIIISDDLNMGGAHGGLDEVDRFRAAKDAGCDFILLCNNRKGVVAVLDKVAYSAYLNSEDKSLCLQGQCFERPYHTNPRWQKIRNDLQQYFSTEIKT